MYKLKNNVPQSVMINMYYAFIYSIMNYGILLWGNNYKSRLNKIIILQKRAVRIISNSQYLTHTNSLFKNLKILKLQDIVRLEVLKFVYKHKFNKLPHIFQNYFHTSQLHLRNSSLIIPRHKTNYRAFSIQVQGAKIFNQFNSKHKVDFSSINSLVKYYIKSTLNTY